jgi:hypothetical protein
VSFVSDLINILCTCHFKYNVPCWLAICNIIKKLLHFMSKILGILQSVIEVYGMEVS